MDYISGPEWDDDKGGAEGSAGGADVAENGDNGHDEAQAKPKTDIQAASETMVGQMVEATDGLLCKIDDAMAMFMYKDRRSKKPHPWKAMLEIGEDIRISTVGYIQVNFHNKCCSYELIMQFNFSIDPQRSPKTWKKTLAKTKPNEDIEELKADTTFVRNNEDQTVIDRYEDMVESYKYGSDLITVTDEDKETYKYNGGPKAFQTIGFIPQREVQRQHLMGEGCMEFQPAEGDDVS